MSNTLCKHCMTPIDFCIEACGCDREQIEKLKAERDALKKENQQLHEWRENFHHQHALSWRMLDPCLNNICKTCDGSGVKTYGSTSTWRGGMSGQMITRDVCDSCWGSGDVDRKGVNLQKIFANKGERDG